MIITKTELGACRTNVYLVESEKKNAVLIDPADDAETLIQTIEARGLNLRYILVTHGHTDHVLALREVRDHFHAPVVISQIDAWRLEDEALINERPYVKTPYQAVKPDILVREGDRITLDELNFSFYAMPGHTEGAMAVVLDDIIFSGDALLFEKHGKTTLPGGDEPRLIESIARMLREFSGDYRVCPGHGKETTLAHERACGRSMEFTGY